MERVHEGGSGLAVGAVVAFWAVEMLRRQLYGLAPSDSSLWIAAGLATVVTASLATGVPAAWASRANPLNALRSDD
jgi:hypothetical protein